MLPRGRPEAAHFPISTPQVARLSRPDEGVYRFAYDVQINNARDLPVTVAQHVERAIFVVAELPKPALIPCCSWLWAALHIPEEPGSRLAPFQGCYHGFEAGPKSPIFHVSTRRWARRAAAEAAARAAQVEVATARTRRSHCSPTTRTSPQSDVSGRRSTSCTRRGPLGGRRRGG